MIWCIIIILLVILIFNYYKKHEGFTNYKYTAVIIEPREHPALEFVLQNFNDNLSDEWGFIIFHGNKNNEYTKKICDKIFIPSRIKIINLNIDNLTSSQYSSLFYKNILYDNIPTETFLIFQTDSIICKKHKDLINKFLEYDYVGAPLLDETVLNGGLSLRKKSKMLELLENCKNNLFIDEENRFEHEDRVFANYTDRCKPYVKLNKPSFEDAKEFSIEPVYNDKSFGIHKSYYYLDKKKQSKIEEWCPEAIKLREFNGY